MVSPSTCTEFGCVHCIKVCFSCVSVSSNAILQVLVLITSEIFFFFHIPLLVCSFYLCSMRRFAEKFWDDIFSTFADELFGGIYPIFPIIIIYDFNMSTTIGSFIILAKILRDVKAI